MKPHKQRLAEIYKIEQRVIEAKQRMFEAQMRAKAFDNAMKAFDMVAGTLLELHFAQAKAFIKGAKRK